MSLKWRLVQQIVKTKGVYAIMQIHEGFYIGTVKPSKPDVSGTEQNVRFR